MAQKVQVLLVDDIDGSTASETVSFSFEGTSYEIDLNDQHAARFRDVMAEWVGAARRGAGRGQGGGGARRGSRGGGAGGGSSNRRRSAEIRSWAKEQGLSVNERGRIPASIVDRFEEAHS